MGAPPTSTGRASSLLTLTTTFYEDDRNRRYLAVGVRRDQRAAPHPIAPFGQRRQCALYPTFAVGSRPSRPTPGSRGTCFRCWARAGCGSPASMSCAHFYEGVARFDTGMLSRDDAGELGRILAMTPDLPKVSEGLALPDPGDGSIFADALRFLPAACRDDAVRCIRRCSPLLRRMHWRGG